jgi:Xaa-Pro aminopeptidase
MSTVQPTNHYVQRLSRVRAAMNVHGLDTLIFTPGAAMRYLTGFSEPAFERLLAVIVPNDADWLFVTPSLNAGQVRENPAGITDVRVWDDASGWEKLVHEVCVDLTLDIGIIGLDDDMPARFALTLRDIMPTTLFKLASPALSELRATKDMLELAALQHAADATDALIPIATGACVPGATELDVDLAIHKGLSDLGAAASFSPIVGAGANGASPHHHTGKTRIKRGDVVVLDFGAMVEGYHGDITRTVAVGEASDEAKRVYEIVLAAHNAALAAVQPGATAHEVDAAARKVIDDAGYGEFFMHRTGHGIGLDDHETPYIVGGNYTRLAPGHCFSIEPGIYLPGKFGVRLENIVTVTEEGTARSFNQAIPDELQIV